MTEQESNSFREQRRLNRENRRNMLIARRMQRRVRYCQNMRHANKSWFGIGIIIIGLVWLLHVWGIQMPEWLFTWPMLLITLGLFSGLASRFRNMASIVLIFIGIVFLARDSIWPETDLGKFIWPVLFIFLGIVFLVKRRDWDHREEWFKNNPGFKKMHEKWHDEWHNEWHSKRTDVGDENSNPSGTNPGGPAAQPEEHENKTGGVFGSFSRQQAADDWLDVTTLFGGVRRIVISKNFKGGDLTNVCGGTILDLSHADIQGMAVIDVVGLWGGIKVAVPPNWEVRLNVTHLMAGTDDRRKIKGHDPNKVLIFTGTMLMAGIEITDSI